MPRGDLFSAIFRCSQVLYKAILLWLQISNWKIKTVTILCPHACDNVPLSVKRFHFLSTIVFVNHHCIHQRSRCLKKCQPCSAQSEVLYSMCDTPYMIVMNCAMHNAEIPFYKVNYKLCWMFLSVACAAVLYLVLCMHNNAETYHACGNVL